MDNKSHIVPYSTYVYILLLLLSLTGISVAVTSLELGTLTVTAALVLASIKSFFVLSVFMHLKFENKFYGFLVAAVFLLLSSVIFITFLDYSNR